MTPPISMEAGGPASRLFSHLSRAGKAGIAPFRKAGLAALLMSVTALGGCAHKFIPPDINYDSAAPAKLTADPPAPVKIVELPKPLPLPGQLKPLDGGKPPPRSGRSRRCASIRPTPPRACSRCATASSTPCRSIRSPAGALYQVYTAPGEITDIALQEGEQLVGSGPVAAGDTVRWIIGDTESGAGATKKVHILVKPTRPELMTNLVINTDRRTYLLELRSTEKTYMASVSWQYPEDQLIALRAAEPGGRSSRADRHRRRSRRDQLPLRDRGRQSGLAAAARLRRRPEGLHRVPARHPPGRDAAAVRHRSGRRLRARELPRQRATTTSSIACSPPPSCVSATRTASGASASSAPMEGRGHDGRKA